MLDILRGELQLHRPTRLILPTDPTLVYRAEIGELRAHRDAERGLRVGFDLAADQHGHGKRLPDDVLPLSQDGPFEAGDVRLADTEQRGDLGGRQARADLRLDVSRA